MRGNSGGLASSCRVLGVLELITPPSPTRHQMKPEATTHFSSRWSVSGSNDLNEVVSGQQCCVFEKVVLGQPLLEIGFRVDDLFMLVKWLAILMLGWVVRGWVATPAAASFTSGAWLDILDAVVFSR